MQINSSLKLYIIAGLFLLNFAGIGCDSGTPEQVKTESEIQVLADKYLYDTSMNKSEIAIFRTQLTELTPLDSIKFFQKLRIVQGMSTETINHSDPSGIALEIDDYLNDMASDEQVNRFLLPRKLIEKRVADRFKIDISGSATKSLKSNKQTIQNNFEKDEKALCIPGQASCETASFPHSAAYWHCANSNCTYGYMNDRVSNDICEWVGCDHRIWYPTGSWRATKVDGLTTATDCLVNQWDNIISDYDGSNTKLLYGYGGAVKCGIFSSNYIQTNTWVQQ